MLCVAKSHNLALKKGEGAASNRMRLRFIFPSFPQFHQLVEWDYPTFHLSMRCYQCSVISGSLTLLEHEAAAWLDREHLHSVKWLPADDVILDEIDRLLFHR